MNLKCPLHSFGVHLKDCLSNSQLNTAKARDAVKEWVRSRLPLQLCLASLPPSLMCTVVQSCSHNVWSCPRKAQQGGQRGPAFRYLFSNSPGPSFYMFSRPVMRTVNSFIMVFPRMSITMLSMHIHARTLTGGRRPSGLWVHTYICGSMRIGKNSHASLQVLSTPLTLLLARAHAPPAMSRPGPTSFPCDPLLWSLHVGYLPREERQGSSRQQPPLLL